MDDLKRLDKALELLFPGRYRSAELQLVTDHDGNARTFYRCYVEGFPYGNGTTIGLALFEMMKDGEGPK